MNLFENAQVENLPLTFVPLSLWILLDIPGMGTDFLVLEVLVAGTNGLLVATPEEDICLCRRWRSLTKEPIWEKSVPAKKCVFRNYYNQYTLTCTVNQEIFIVKTFS